MTNGNDVTLVILGATGDLTRRLLMPAIYRLFVRAQWQPRRIVGYGRSEWTDERFREHLEKSLKEFAREAFDRKSWKELAARLTYRSGELHADHLQGLAELVDGPAIFYLALPPGLFGEAAEALGQAGLHREEGGWRRIVIEKPFGSDLESALALHRQIHRYWQESQVYRIDHYLGKETVQNLMVFRFANRFIEPVWNTAHVEQVQITVAETLGLEGRWRYYDQAGALRDMLQNHLMQLFTLTAMEPPAVWHPEVLRDHKVEVLRAVRPIPETAVERFAARGQYAAGTVQGQQVPGYREEPNIPRDSRTETFAAVKFFVDTWRWKGVPFYLRSGKRLRADYSEVAIGFREVPTHLFRQTPLEGLSANWLIFRLKPSECIDLYAWARAPGLQLNARHLVLSAPFRQDDEPEFSAYEQLLLDVVRGDRTHFLRHDEVEWAWRVLDPVLKAWQHGAPEPYAAGSEGPTGQHRILEPGHVWRPIGKLDSP
ncbi:glucose-6-phosphate dehydrogenase [Rhodothermus marinus]|uniref:glucose-6-phosphate dehydrogenase n=1 Tax=Rhodothermus marinus TaxID=29549 RepID=UPI0006D094D6|nr:glucose-6-phosphate dehydrogenase [Rhodothermus marinus]